MNKFDKLVKEVEGIIFKSPVKTDLAHARSARKWVLKLKPDADQALEIAALAHDIERGVEPKYNKLNREKWGDYNEHKKRHSERSAKLLVQLLQKYDFDGPFIDKVKRLVLGHEFGGDEETDILVDADSLSFFEENFEGYYTKYGEEDTRKKIRFMYDRMSDQSKNFLSGFKYDDSKLDSIFKEEIKK